VGVPEYTSSHVLRLGDVRGKNSALLSCSEEDKTSSLDLLNNDQQIKLLSIGAGTRDDFASLGTFYKSKLRTVLMSDGQLSTIAVQNDGGKIDATVGAYPSLRIFDEELNERVSIGTSVLQDNIDNTTYTAPSSLYLFNEQGNVLYSIPK